jgi:hypothetical protein
MKKEGKSEKKLKKVRMEERKKERKKERKNDLFSGYLTLLFQLNRLFTIEGDDSSE